MTALAGWFRPGGAGPPADSERSLGLFLDAAPAAAVIRSAYAEIAVRAPDPTATTTLARRSDTLIGAVADAPPDAVADRPAEVWAIERLVRQPLLPVGFAAARVDPTALVLVTDFVGTHPLHWRRLGNTVHFGTSALALADIAPPAAIDPAAVAELLAFGQLLGTRTLFTDVHALPAGAAFRFDERHVTENLAPRDWPPVDEEQPLAERVAALRHNLAAAVTAAGPAAANAILLSGGLDSRVLLATLLEAGLAVHAHTFGDETSDDVRLARRVATACGVEQTLHPIPATFFDDWLHACAVWTDGAVSALHFHGTHCLPAMARNATRQWNGFAGDAILGGTFAHPRYAWGSPARVERRLGSALQALLDPQQRAALMAPPHRQLALQHPDATLAAIIDEHRQRLPAATAYQVLLTQRVGRLAASGLRLDRAFLPVVTPYAHAPVVHAMRSMSWGDRRYSRLFQALLRRHHPALAAIPWQRTGAAVGTPWPLALMRRSLRGASRRLGLQPAGGIVDYTAWLRGPAAATRQRLIESAAVETAFDTDALRRLAGAPAGQHMPVALDGILMSIGAVAEVRRGEVEPRVPSSS